MHTPTSATVPAPFSVCVYCGARSGDSPAFVEAAQSLGRSIADRRWQLVYGGGKVGLMGVLADAALAAGGRVVGVIPELLMDMEVGHTGLSELQIVTSMHERKRRMAELSQAFIALPGGLGTLEELFEVWTWRHLGYHQRPIGLLNVEGYFDALLVFLRHSQRSGFIDADQQSMLSMSGQAEALLDSLYSAGRKGIGGANLASI